MSNDISQEKYDFYELVENFIDEGYSADEAEDLAWKMIQGNPANWSKTDTVLEKSELEKSEESDSAKTSSDLVDDDIPF